MPKALRLRSIAAVVLATMPMLSVACVELKGPAPDAQGSPVGSDAQSGVDAAVEGSVQTDGGANGVSHPSAAALASKRTRLAAMPTRWVSSNNYVYLATDKLRRILPSTGATVEYTFSVGTDSAITATDEFVAIITDSAASWYDANEAGDSPSIVKRQLLSSIALGTGNFAFTVLESAKPALYVYHPSVAEPLLVSAIDAPAAVIVGTFDRIAFLHAVASTDLWVADTGLRKVSKWVLPSSDLLAVDVDKTSNDPTGVVAAFGPANAPVFKHLGAAGATRDLNGEIAALPPSVAPAEWRQATDERFAQSGKWFIYVSAGGIVAFDRSAARLVPCQLPQSNGVVFRSPRVVEGNILVFELEGGDLGKEGPAGLYGVKLDTVLPP